jgi:hypothetical protein
LPMTWHHEEMMKWKPCCRPSKERDVHTTMNEREIRWILEKWAFFPSWWWEHDINIYIAGMQQ